MVGKLNFMIYYYLCYHTQNQSVMREYANKPENQSRTQDSNPRASRQVPIADILQAYKNGTLGWQPVQHESVEDEELLQAKTLGQAPESSILQRYKESIQRYAPEEDDELLQGKFETTQRAIGDDNELLQVKFDSSSDSEQAPVQREVKPNNTGLPDNLKTGIEDLSGYSMDDVKVHYNSNKPAQLNAFAYAQGTEIHLASGQEQHLPHEAWHVVQQKQGCVQPTTQLQGENVNDNGGLEKEADVMGVKAIQRYMTNFVPQQKQSIIKPIVQREPWDPDKAKNEDDLGDVLNAEGIPGSHSTQIGAKKVVDSVGFAGAGPQTVLGERHFDQQMLDLVQTVFTGLPDSHIKGNASLARVVLQEAGGPAGGDMASFYEPEQKSLNLVVPGDVASWIYMQVDNWPFGDSATTLISEIDHVAEQWRKYQRGNITSWDFFKEAISAPGRFFTHNVTSSGTTLGKLKQGLSTESFVQWIIRHETGHSVDDAIGWYANNHFQNPACGGWEIPVEANMVLEILNTVGINDGALANLNAAYNPSTKGGYNSMLNAVQSRRIQDLNPPYRGEALNVFEGTNPGGARLVAFAENVIEVGLSRPWESGGAVNVGGRAYHRDTQNNEWVSYIHHKYALRNSNYQFQNPAEWFAESYQAYFKGYPANLGQNLNDPIARGWFTDNLVPPPAGGGLLIDNQGDLVRIIDSAPDVAAPGAGTAVIPGRVKEFLTAISNIGVNIVKIPFDIAMGTALLPVKILKQIPPVNWALRWLGF